MMGSAQRVIQDAAANHSKLFETRTAPAELVKTATQVITSYGETREANKQKLQDLNVCYGSQKDEARKTKADIVNEVLGHPVPALGGEMRADLAKIPFKTDRESETPFAEWNKEYLC